MPRLVEAEEVKGLLHLFNDVFKNTEDDVEVKIVVILLTLVERPLMSQRGSEQSAELPARLVPEMSSEESLMIMV